MSRRTSFRFGGKKKKKRAGEQENNALADPKNSPLLRRISAFIGKRKKNVGKGHHFEREDIARPTWCDICDELIWGLFRRCTICRVCKYTIHETCLNQIAVTCRGSVPDGDQVNKKSSAHNTPDIGPHGVMDFLDEDAVKRHLEEYNKNNADASLELLDDSEKQFKGYIRVVMNLTRPIRVATEEAFYQLHRVGNSPTPDSTPSSSLSRTGSGGGRWNHGSGSGSASHYRGVESCFYLPSNVSKGLYLTSKTTSQEVISILLTKFKIISNPKKFALYERHGKDNSTRRLRRYEEPLVLKLLWGISNAQEDFELVLQESHDEEELIWDDFTTPELENFVQILEIEEQQHVAQIRKRYETKRERLTIAIAECTNLEPAATPDATEEDLRKKCDELELHEVKADAEAAIEELMSADADAAIAELQAEDVLGQIEALTMDKVAEADAAIEDLLADDEEGNVNRH